MSSPNEELSKIGKKISSKALTLHDYYYKKVIPIQRLNEVFENNVFAK